MSTIKLEQSEFLYLSKVYNRNLGYIKNKLNNNKRRMYGQQEDYKNIIFKFFDYGYF